MSSTVVLEVIAGRHLDSGRELGVPVLDIREFNWIFCACWSVLINIYTEVLDLSTGNVMDERGSWTI